MANGKDRNTPRRQRKSERPPGPPEPRKHESGEHHSPWRQQAAPPVAPDAQTELALRLTQGIARLGELEEKIEAKLEQLDARAPLHDPRREPEPESEPPIPIERARARRSRMSMAPHETLGAENPDKTVLVNIDIYPAHKRFVMRAVHKLGPGWTQARFYRDSALHEARRVLREDPPETAPYQTGPKGPRDSGPEPAGYRAPPGRRR